MIAISNNIGVNGGTMSAAVNITDIADWFLSKESMTHKKLQKLCYYAVAWGWTLMEKPLVDKGVEFQAWKHGPVSAPLYGKYKDHGWNSIPKLEKRATMPNDIEELLESVWLTYGDKSGNELEALSHSEEPWIKARGTLKDSEPSSEPIDPEVMKIFYNGIKSTEY